MVADRIHLRPRLIDFTVDYPLRILSDARVAQRLGVEVVFNEIVRRHQFGRTGSRQQISILILGMTHADVAEGVNDALVGNDPIGECELPAGFVKCVRHKVSFQEF